VADDAQRLFIAVPVPPAALAACRAVVDPVRTGPLGRNARWVRTENLHLTVRFLGDTDPSLVPALAGAVAAAAASVEAFGVELAGAGAFPDGRHPRTLWLGVARGNDGLEALDRALAAPLAGLGVSVDPRPRRPHLTIARTDATSPAVSHALGDALLAAAAGWSATFEAGTLVLYRSHLGGGPPRYEPVVEAPLRR
jgi:RNA 2',3'-cyclic 3'-phosphodiesterase